MASNLRRRARSPLARLAHRLDRLDTRPVLVPRIVDGGYAFVTNSAANFRRLCVQRKIHVCLVIIVPRIQPARPRAIFDALLETVQPSEELVNEVIEISLDADDAVFTRCDLPQADDGD